MSSPHSEFIAGIKYVSPILLGIVPFATISGIAAMEAGFSESMALMMSVIVFAGASQIAAVHLIDVYAPIAIIILTAFVINLRFVMYSASIASYFKSLPLKWKALFSYLLTDQAYAVSIIRFNETDADLKHSHWFYLGSAITLWLTWQSGTAVGIFLGTNVPESWSLSFAVPLTFMALVTPAIKDKPSIIAAVTAGVAAAVSASFPYNLNIIFAAIAGMTAGVFTEMLKKEEKIK